MPIGRDRVEEKSRAKELLTISDSSLSLYGEPPLTQSGIVLS